MGTVSDLRKGVMHMFMQLYVSSSIFPLQSLAYHVWASAAARFFSSESPTYLLVRSSDAAEVPPNT